jgi:transcriptional regulator with XRE-family HTH domain
MDGHLRRAFGASLRTRREIEKLTQRDFARLLGIDHTCLRGLERGEHNVSLNRVERIAYRLGVDPLLLLSASAVCQAGRAAAEDRPAWTLTAANARQIRETVATNVRRERRSARLSQRALAQTSRIGEDTVVRLEKGQQEPRLATLVAFSFALRVPLSVFLLDLPAPQGLSF